MQASEYEFKIVYSGVDKSRMKYKSRVKLRWRRRRIDIENYLLLFCTMGNFLYLTVKV